MTMTITLLTPSQAAPTFWSGYSITPMPPAELPNPDDRITMPYQIIGPKKQWGLCRNQNTPSLLFPVPHDFTVGPMAIKGVKWFRESIQGNAITLTPC